MAGTRFLNLADVISQEKAEEILRPYEDDLREPFFAGWRAWTDLASFDPAYHARATRRGRASLVFDHVMHDAKARFDGRQSEGIRTSDDFCHNLCCLIQSHYELGINATFWGEEPAASPPVAEPAEVDPAEMLAWV